MPALPAAFRLPRLICRNLALLAGLALMGSGCGQDAAERQQPAPGSSTGQQETATVQPPAVEARPLAAVRRTELLAAFAGAADAAAAGQSLPETNRALIGRTFTLGLPFGCNGETAADQSAWAGWTFDEARRTLKLSARPERWSEVAWVQAMAADLPHEAVEGFWIERPWTSSEDCPSVQILPDSGLAPAGERPTIGMAQFFAPDSPRTFQRGSRPYAHTLRLGEATQLEGRFYRLTLTGRIAGFPDGQPIRCVQDSPAHRPVCLMAVELAQVAFEDPRDGSTLTAWRN